jgi:hypothetical protein
VRLKMQASRADALQVIITPKYVAWAQNPELPETEFDSDVDLSRWSDDQLSDGRDRRMEALSELTRRPGGETADKLRIDGIARDVKLITAELVRRARARHPSSQPWSGR